MYQYAEKLETLHSFDALWSGLVSAFRQQGINDVIHITATGVVVSNVVVHSTLPALYTGFETDKDPFLLCYCDTYDIALTGPEFLSEPNCRSCGSRELFRQARKLGFHSGFAIPTRLRCAQQYGGFVLATGLPAEDFRTRLRPRAEEFRLFCLLMHRKIEELGGVMNECDPDLIAAGVGGGLGCLSPRELEIVTLLAKGLSRKEAARVCRISQHTVSDYAKSAYRKLGVHNRVQAAQLIYSASTPNAIRKSD